jgi:hypothetical protein
MMMVVAGVALATAAGFQVQGNMSEVWDESSLRVRVGEGGAQLWFNLPSHSGVTVVAKPDTGAAVTTRLNMPASVNLRLPSTYDITVTRDSGEGQWTCKNVLGSPALLGFGTSVDPKRHARVTYTTDDQKDNWTFTWPKEATFLVQVINASGKVVEEQDLYYRNELELVGGGSFTFEVVPTDGSGEFAAKKSE